MKRTACGARRRRHAICAAVFVAAAALLTLGANALAQALRVNWDVSDEQYTVLSAETKSVLEGLGRDVYLYYTGGSELDDLRVSALLKNYAAASGRVSYRLVDTSAHAGFTQLFDPGQQGIEPGSVIVSDSDGLKGETPGRFKVLGKNDLYLASEPYYNEAGALVSDYRYFRAERQITSAINYIVTERTYGVVFLGAPPAPALLDDLNGQYYGTRTGEPASVTLDARTDTLVVISPQSDLSEERYRAIKAFLDAGGKAVFFLDAPADGTAAQARQSFGRCEALLEGFGLRAELNVVIGEDPAYTYMSRLNLTPVLNPDSEVTAPVLQNKLSPVLSYAGAVTVLGAHGVETSVLLSTDATSFARPSRAELGMCRKTGDDESGPFVIGALSKKGDAAVALYGSSSLVATDAAYGIPGNRQLLLSTFAVLRGRRESGAIRMQTVYSAADRAYKISVPPGQKAVIIAVTAVVLPLGVLLAGVSRWYRRRL